MARYTDIDLSLKRNTKGDFSVLEDANVIKASIYNRLLISNSELYFKDGDRIVIIDYLFEDDDFITRNSIRETIQNVIETDNRIAALQSLKIFFNSDDNRYEIELSIVMKTDTVNSQDNRTLDITLFLNKQSI